jgi:hypothetical protein
MNVLASDFLTYALHYVVVRIIWKGVAGGSWHVVALVILALVVLVVVRRRSRW